MLDGTHNQNDPLRSEGNTISPLEMIINRAPIPKVALLDFTTSSLGLPVMQVATRRLRDVLIEANSFLVCPQ